MEKDSFFLNQAILFFLSAQHKSIYLFNFHLNFEILSAVRSEARIQFTFLKDKYSQHYSPHTGQSHTSTNIHTRGPPRYPCISG